MAETKNDPTKSDATKADNSSPKVADQKPAPDSPATDSLSMRDLKAWVADPGDTGKRDKAVRLLKHCGPLVLDGIQYWANGNDIVSKDLHPKPGPTPGPVTHPRDKDLD